MLLCVHILTQFLEIATPSGNSIVPGEILCVKVAYDLKGKGDMLIKRFNSIDILIVRGFMFGWRMNHYYIFLLPSRALNNSAKVSLDIYCKRSYDCALRDAQWEIGICECWDAPLHPFLESSYYHVYIIQNQSLIQKKKVNFSVYIT